MLTGKVLRTVVGKMDKSFTYYNDLALKAPVILQEAVTAIEYSSGSGLDDSLIYEIVECASKCDFRLAENKWKDVKKLLSSIFEDGGFDNLKFDDIERVLSESPSWEAKRAIIKLAFEAVKGTK